MVNEMTDPPLRVGQVRREPHQLEGFQAPGVVVYYTDDPKIQNGSKFLAQGLQIAAGVPLMCDEGDDYRSFRLGLFGLDKLLNVDRTVATLEKALDKITGL